MNNNIIDAETLRTIRHDIKNQLSNISLALEALEYENTKPSEDFTFCINTISTSARHIDELIKRMVQQ